MKKQYIFFGLLFFVAIVLFGFLYFLGFMNLLNPDSPFFTKFKWLEFAQPVLSLFYLIIVTIFFLITASIMFRLIISLKVDPSNQKNKSNVSNNEEKNHFEDIEKHSEHKKIGLDITDKNSNAYKQKEDIKTEQERRAEIEHKLEEEVNVVYQNINQMSTDILNSRNVKELLEKTVFWGAVISASKRASIMVVDKNKELYIYRTIGWSKDEQELINSIRVPMGEGLSGKVALENKKIFVANVDYYKSFDFIHKDKYKTKSFIIVPIYGLQRVIAVLNFTESQKRYTLGQLEALDLLTKLASKSFELLNYKRVS